MNVENAKKSGKRRRICPSCQSGAVISIIYGLPGPEAIKEAEEGLIAQQRKDLLPSVGVWWMMKIRIGSAKHVNTSGSYMYPDQSYPLSFTEE
jgi:hypothetical protein